MLSFIVLVCGLYSVQDLRFVMEILIQLISDFGLYGNALILEVTDDLKQDWHHET